jgi:hypothetical protein
MTPYRDGPGRAAHRFVVERLFNERLFGILKQNFRELLDVTYLHVTFVPDIVVCCCLLHNVLLGQAPGEDARLSEILQRDGVILHIDDDP